MGGRSGIGGSERTGNRSRGQILSALRSAWSASFAKSATPDRSGRPVRGRGGRFRREGTAVLRFRRGEVAEDARARPSRHVRREHRLQRSLFTPEVHRLLGTYRGDHHIFTRDDVAEILNLQPRDAMAKPYQVRQVRSVIVHYKLGDLANE